MDNKDQNWLNLFGDHTPEGWTWHAQTTVYSLDKTVLKEYQFTRSFKASLDKTIVNHHNTYFLPDGSLKEQSWELKQEDCSQVDGVVHPESQGMRTLSFGQGITAWMPRELDLTNNFGGELFFRDRDWRYSAIIVYNPGGKLDRFVTIREQLDDFPKNPHQPPLEQVKGEWKGFKTVMESDLKILPKQEVDNFSLDPSNGQSKMIYLPDAIVVNAPEKLAKGDAFELSAGKLFNETEYKRLLVRYDASGVFESLTFEQFNLQ